MKFTIKIKLDPCYIALFLKKIDNLKSPENIPNFSSVSKALLVKNSYLMFENKTGPTPMLHRLCTSH